MASADNVNIDISPDVIPLQAGSAPSQQPIVARTVGTISTIAGLPGPDILIATGAATKGLSIVAAPVGSTITFSISGVTTAVKESGGATLDIGAVADGQLLQRVGATVVGVTADITVKRLASFTFNVNSAASQIMYTVPLTKTAIITAVIARNASVDLGAGSSNNMSFGFDTPPTDWSPAVAMAIFDIALATQFKVFSQEFGATNGVSVVGAGGDRFRGIVDTAYGSAATVVIDILGYEF